MTRVSHWMLACRSAQQTLVVPEVTHIFPAAQQVEPHGVESTGPVRKTHTLSTAMFCGTSARTTDHRRPVTEISAVGMGCYNRKSAGATCRRMRPRLIGCRTLQERYGRD